MVMMQNHSFYEQVGIVTPGAVFLFGLMFYLPELRDVLAKDGISIGGFGIFLIISYATGHLLAAAGNVIEKLYWNAWGGMPSNWVIGKKPRLFCDSQLAILQVRISARLGLTIAPLRELNIKDWKSVFRQIYSDVAMYGKPDRADTFNGNYGLNRGLCAATISLAIVVMIQAPSQWTVATALVVTSLVYLYRTHRFGVYYAREVFNQFLLLPAEPGKLERATPREGDFKP